MNAWRRSPFFRFDVAVVTVVAVLIIGFSLASAGGGAADSPTAHATAAVDALFQRTDQASLALLFSVRHDFPTEWSAFVSGTADFGAVIRRDRFPYFTKGKKITITSLDLYGSDTAKPRAAGDPAAATTALSDNQEFAFTAAADVQILTRSPAAEVFMIIRYLLSQ